jgi:flagella basal body P-ring formation protein FlgA
MRALALVAALAAGPALAGEITAAHTLRVGAIVAGQDLRVSPDAAEAADALVGMEVRRAIYAGRPVTPADLGPPLLVQRNAIVTMMYRTGALAIRTEGRALDMGGAGERVRIINLDSRISVVATVVSHNTVEVLR